MDKITVEDVASELRTHKAVAEERYNHIVAMLTDIRKAITWIFTLLFGSMASVIVGLLGKALFHG